MRCIRFGMIVVVNQFGGFVFIQVGQQMMCSEFVRVIWVCDAIDVFDGGGVLVKVEYFYIVCFVLC